MLDVLDRSGAPTGEVVPKSETHRRGLWHRCFHCWVCDPGSPGGPYLLFQRRAGCKETWPGRLDTTAAGHLAAGESALDGRRELEEELGLRADPGRFIPLGTRRIEVDHPLGRDRELHEVFLLLDSTPPEELRLQREEVESVIRLGLDEIEALSWGESVPAEEWNDGEVVRKRIHPSELVLNEDGYPLRVARAARKVLAGEEPGPVF